MRTPQPTAQYGQVFRVSIVRASLKLRVSANTGWGENPSNARLDPPRPAAQALKNCRRLTSMDITSKNLSHVSHSTAGECIQRSWKLGPRTHAQRRLRRRRAATIGRCPPIDNQTCNSPRAIQMSAGPLCSAARAIVRRVPRCGSHETFGVAHRNGVPQRAQLAAHVPCRGAVPLFQCSRNTLLSCTSAQTEVGLA